VPAHVGCSSQQRTPARFASSLLASRARSWVRERSKKLTEAEELHHCGHLPDEAELAIGLLDLRLCGCLAIVRGRQLQHSVAVSPPQYRSPAWSARAARISCASTASASSAIEHPHSLLSPRRLPAPLCDRAPSKLDPHVPQQTETTVDDAPVEESPHQGIRTSCL
jgi:hypothetical protein